MWYECTNPKHKNKILFSYKATKDRKGNKIIPACPDCRSKKHVGRMKRQTKRRKA